MCEHKQIIYTSLNLNIIFAKIKESLAAFLQDNSESKFSKNILNGINWY